jgi:ABC-type nitrate/sulfonate/bicarbonate transport system permease component
MATLTARELITTQAPPAVRGVSRWRAFQPTVLSLLGGIILWETAGRLIHFSFLPPFSAVLAATWRMMWSGEILSNLTASLTALFIGYSLAVLIAVPLGVLIGRFRTLEFVFDPYINALLATPSLLYVPIFFGLFGVSRMTQVAVVFVYSSIMIVVMCISGVRSVDPNLVEMARSFGATERQLLVRVLLPGALPMVMAGLRLGMGRAVRGMINGEMLIVLIGLGALLRQYGSRFDAASVFGILLVVIVVALLCTSSIQWLERRVTRWAG